MLVNLRRISVAATTLDITPKAADLSVPTHMCLVIPCPKMLILPRQNLIERLARWVFDLILDLWEILLFN